MSRVPRTHRLLNRRCGAFPYNIYLCFHLLHPASFVFCVHVSSPPFLVKKNRKLFTMVLSRSLQKPSSFNTDEEIEEDPFGYILSPSLSAGICKDKSSRSPSPFWIKASSSSSSSFSSSDRLAKVKRWVLRIESYYLRGKLPGQGGKQQQHSTPNPAKAIIADGTTRSIAQVRDRNDVRNSSANREVHRMGAIPGRQHLWRKPSESLWPVVEESENVAP